MRVELRQLLIAVPVLVLAANAAPADLKEVTVDRVDGRYVLRSETLFAASREELYAVLTNYDLFDKFTSAFTESRNLDPDEEGRPQFYNRMEGCILLFCVSFERYGHLVLDPLTNIEAIVDPARSDFDYSVERWELIEHGDKTLLIYEFEMEPSFWVPPVIGPYMIRRTLKSGGGNAVNRIEALAQGKEPRF